MGNALKLPGSSQRGRQIFVSRCSACHGVGPGPHAPGYVLEFNPLQKERLLHTIVEPGVNLRPTAAASVIFGKTGDLWIGRIRNQNKQTLTVEQTNGSEAVLPQINIADIYAQPWSIMPEGLETGLNPQNMADLMEFVIRVSTRGAENIQGP